MDEAATIQRVSATAGEQLVDLVNRAIDAGLDDRRPPVPDLSVLHADLSEARGAFVTLRVRGELNGCIGSIEGEEPLGIAASRHAWSAAFADPRLPPLRRADHEHLEIEVSVLSPLSPLPAGSRSELLNALRPRVDGLLIAVGTGRAVFLPSVWDQLPSADQFVEHLLLKAGLAPDVWPTELRAHRFNAQKFSHATGDVEGC